MVHIPKTKREIVNEIIGRALDDIKHKTGITLDAKLNNRIVEFYPDKFDKDIIFLKFEDIEKIIVDILELQFIMPKKGLATPKRKREIIDARIIFSDISRKFYFTLMEIGKYTNRHHSTIIHHTAICKDLLKTNPEFKRKYDLIYNKITELYDQTI